MKTTEICARLEETTYWINAFTGSEVLHPDDSIATGSAVAISAAGDLLTAAHVVTGRLPVRQEDLRDPRVTIVGMRKAGELARYRPGICGLALNQPYLKEPLTIDLALLHPVSSQSSIPHLNISREPVQLGTRVLMAGFPDDMELPFSFDRMLNPNDPEVDTQRTNVRIARQLLMIKSGMIGHRSGIKLSDGSLSLEGEVMYIDNELHTGASGGPVVDTDMRIVGIMTNRAITSVAFREMPDLRIPSGSTVALSPRVIQSWIDKTQER